MSVDDDTQSDERRLDPDDRRGRTVFDQGTLVPIAFVVVVIGGVLWLTSALNSLQTAADTRAAAASADAAATKALIAQTEQRLVYRLDGVDSRISGVVQVWELRALFLRMQIDNPLMKVPEVR